MVKHHSTHIGSRGMSPQDVHQFNRRQVLAFFYKAKAASRAELADQLQLSIPAISKIIDELIEEQFIEAEESLCQSSRRNERYRISQDRPHTVCVYLSPTLLKVLIVDGGMRPLSSLLTAPITPVSPDEFLSGIVALITKAISMQTCQRYRLALACHGQVDIKTGASLQMSQAPWKSVVELKYLLQSRLGYPVAIDNDCVMVALAEKWLRDNQQDFCVINLDYGIGSSFLISGEIYRGRHFGSGQIGHSIVMPGGPLCGCGRHGCLETQASIAAIEQNYAAYSHQPAIAFAAIVARYRAGESIAVEVVNRAARMVGLSLYNFVVTLDINHILLYGACCEFGEHWLQQIIEETTGNPFESDVALSQEQTQIQIGQLDEAQQLTGIGYLWVERELNDIFTPFW